MKEFLKMQNAQYAIVSRIQKLLAQHLPTSLQHSATFKRPNNSTSPNPKQFSPTPGIEPGPHRSPVHALTNCAAGYFLQMDENKPYSKPTIWPPMLVCCSNKPNLILQWGEILFEVAFLFLCFHGREIFLISSLIKSGCICLYASFMANNCQMSNIGTGGPRLV